MLFARRAWFLIPVLGVVELVGHCVFSRRAPDADEWARLPALVAEFRRPGDLVVVAPTWAEPLVRHALGDALMPLADVARADTSDRRTLLEVSILGAKSEEAKTFREVSELEVEPFRLRRLENPAYRSTLYQFDEHVRPDSLDVFEGAAESRAPCGFTSQAPSSTGGLGGHATYPRERYRCSGGESFFVGVTVIDDEGYRPRRCIFAHPPAGGGPLSLVFSGVPSGSAIHGYAGLPYLIFRDGVGPPVTITAFVNGARVGQSVHHDEAGFSPFDFGIPAQLRGPGEVRFEISSEEPSTREFCFTAALR